jgi:hypothetical protein
MGRQLFVEAGGGFLVDRWSGRYTFDGISDVTFKGKAGFFIAWSGSVNLR